MRAPVEITPWHWGGFILFVLLLLALDLGFLHRQAKAVSFKQALRWTAIWVALAMAFGLMMIPMRGKGEALQFFTGYFIELSLSMDNMFVIALIFTSFKTPAEYQHRVLFWGIIGALVMRGVMIILGVALIEKFDWLLYLFGAFLILTGIRMGVSKEKSEPEKGFVTRIAEKVLPLSPSTDGSKFTTRVGGRLMLTPLFLVLLAVETSDLFFAVDSIPAVFGVTRKPFIVFTSNVFAILGLRSMYFLLAGALGLFRFLKPGIAVVLVFIGIKMLIDPHDHPPKWFQYDIPDMAALGVVVLIIAISIGASLLVARKKPAGTS